jgi:predicted ATP-dependent serine protease
MEQRIKEAIKLGYEKIYISGMQDKQKQSNRTRDIKIFTSISKDASVISDPDGTAPLDRMLLLHVSA